jgi:hypothetical protein
MFEAIGFMALVKMAHCHHCNLKSSVNYTKKTSSFPNTGIFFTIMVLL